MPIRSLLVTAAICGSAAAAAAQSSPAPRPAIAAPRYVGPMGSNPTPSAFAAPQPANAPMISPKTFAAGPLRTKKSTCYAIHSYTITPESDTVGIDHPASESTCVAADTFSMKQAGQPANGPEFR